MRLRFLALAVTAAALGLGGCAVIPAVPFQHSTFEGFDVVSYVPEHPRGLVYVFHGTNGSAAFAERVETVDVLNKLIKRGYGFVSTSSTERTGDKRWNVSNPSTTTNPDLARLARLQDHLVATSGVEASTPLVGIGMSNGARFVTLWGQVWKDHGYPVRAIWASMGRIAPPVSKLTVPTVFSTAENDFTSPPGPIIADYAATQQAGTPTELFVSRERALSPSPYLRIPNIDETEAREIFDAFVATGVWNAQGKRVVADPETAANRAATVTLPASVRGESGSIQDETALQLAVHQFTAEFGDRVADFFDFTLGTR